MHACTVQVLQLSSNAIGPDGVKALAPHLRRMVALRELNLGYNGICADGIKLLTAAPASSPGSTSLTALSIYPDGPGAPLDTTPLDTTVNLLQLSKLAFRCNALHAEGARALAPCLTAMSNLQTLDLHSNYIGPAGAGTLSEYLAGMPGLKALHLGLNIIGDGGAVALAPGLKAMHMLQTLTLCDNGIGAVGVAALAGSLCELANLQVCPQSDVPGERCSPAHTLKTWPLAIQCTVARNCVAAEAHPSAK